MRSRAELEWARERPLACRPPIPNMGDRVLYRTNDFFVELLAATVITVIDYDLADPNLWELDDDSSLSSSLVHPVADPWPILILDVGKRHMVETRESRLSGSAGWLPLDWQKYWRPFHDPDFGMEK